MEYTCVPPWGMRIMAMSGGRRGRRGASWGASWGPPGWYGGYGGGKGPFWGGPRVRRGSIRTAILFLLAEEPMHGYQIMQELAERSGGMWRPSPGSIYPTLQQLADEELVRGEDEDGKKVYHLTEAGRAKVETHDTPPPWARFDTDDVSGLFALKDLAIQVGAAVMQVGAAGTDEQLAAAKEILAETRSKLYQLLADGEEPASE